MIEQIYKKVLINETLNKKIFYDIYKVEDSDYRYSIRLVQPNKDDYLREHIGGSLLETVKEKVKESIIRYKRKSFVEKLIEE